MRIATQLRLLSFATGIGLVALGAMLFIYLREFNDAKGESALAVEIRDNFFEQVEFRDRYILYHDEQLRLRWEKNNSEAERWLRRADTEFQRPAERLLLARMRKCWQESLEIFQRMAKNISAV